MSVLVLTKENFDSEVLSSEKTVLVDFWASWCGPCRMLAPIIDEIAAENSDIKVGKVNIDDCPELASAYAIMSIPTLILFKNGKIAEKIIGSRPKAELEKLIKS